MKRIVTSLPFRLLLGVVIGIIAGQLSGTALMNIVVTVKFVLGELINFCVPLIIIGFIAPSITRLGKNASRMLGAAVFSAYVSSILAGLLSMGAGYGLIPHLSVVTETDGLKELPELVFRLEIPQIMSVMSALVLSVLAGLAVAWTKAEMITGVLEEFHKIVLEVVTRIVIPILPVYSGRNIFTEQSDGCYTELRTCIYHGGRDYVVRCHACGCPEMCKEVKNSACNITGDGALTLILTGYADRHKIEKQDLKSVL